MDLSTSISPPSGPAAGCFNGTHLKSNFLAILRLLCSGVPDRPCERAVRCSVCGVQPAVGKSKAAAVGTFLRSSAFCFLRPHTRKSGARLLRPVICLLLAAHVRADPTIPLVPVGVRSNQTPSQVFTNASGIELCRVPAGEFMMGSPKDEPGRDDATESPYHKVRITKPFWIQAREVTQGEWTRVMGSTLKDLSDKNWPEWKRGPDSPPRGPDLPMYWVSWFDAIAFCNKLSEKDDRKPYYKLTNIAYEPYGNGALDKADLEILGGNGYRLPTEAQWEYACRAGSATALSNGRDITSADNACPNLDEIAWYAGNMDTNRVIQPAGSKKPNAWGIYDMHGSMMEWCVDQFDATFYGKSPVDDPVNPPSAEIRNKSAALRSGTFFLPPKCCRSAWRMSGATCARYPHIGFRVVLPVAE